VAGLNWSDDNPSDFHQIAANCLVVLRAVHSDARQRQIPTPEKMRNWHRMLFLNCNVPSSNYVGNFRGDSSFPDVEDYEVGLGSILLDGYTERVGVWSQEVSSSVTRFFAGLTVALSILDVAIPQGHRPPTTQLVDEVIGLCAVAHGEWVRIHPFVNGNGRTARLVANAIALRYELPAFVTLKPRPTNVLYARAGKPSMGRPPTFRGDHTETKAVFAHYLRLALAQP
jgi:fido (protein-threonine AMPylation protein)